MSCGGIVAFVWVAAAVVLMVRCLWHPLRGPVLALSFEVATIAPFGIAFLATCAVGHLFLHAWLWDWLAQAKARLVAMGMGPTIAESWGKDFVPDPFAQAMFAASKLGVFLSCVAGLLVLAVLEYFAFSFIDLVSGGDRSVRSRRRSFNWWTPLVLLGNVPVFAACLATFLLIIHLVAVTVGTG
jgi:hypothetical protein